MMYRSVFLNIQLTNEVELIFNMEKRNEHRKSLKNAIGRAEAGLLASAKVVTVWISLPKVGHASVAHEPFDYVNTISFIHLLPLPNQAVMLFIFAQGQLQHFDLWTRKMD